MSQAGLPGPRPIRRGEQQLSLGFIREGAREQTIDPLMPLALCTEGTQPEAGHGGVDLARVGEAFADHEQAGPQDLPGPPLLEREEALREVVEGILPEERLE